jgi:hypothetical protein
MWSGCPVRADPSSVSFEDRYILTEEIVYVGI